METVFDEKKVIDSCMIAIRMRLWILSHSAFLKWNGSYEAGLLICSAALLLPEGKAV
jgi:hypothetical protein